MIEVCSIIYDHIYNHIYVQEYHENRNNISNNAHCVLALVLVNFARHLDEYLEELAEMERTVREISRMLKEQMSISCKFNWLLACIEWLQEERMVIRVLTGLGEATFSWSGHAQGQI